MDRLAKYFNILLGLVFLGTAAFGVVTLIRNNPYPGMVFQIIGLVTSLFMLIFMGIMNIVIAVRERENYIYKGRNYYIVSDGLLKDRDSREWKKVKIYRAEGVRTQFVRDAAEFEERFRRK